MQCTCQVCTLNLLKIQGVFLCIFLIKANQNKLGHFWTFFLFRDWSVLRDFPSNIDQTLVFPHCCFPNFDQLPSCQSIFLGYDVIKIAALGNKRVKKIRYLHPGIELGPNKMLFALKFLVLFKCMPSYALLYISTIFREKKALFVCKRDVEFDVKNRNSSLVLFCFVLFITC